MEICESNCEMGGVYTLNDLEMCPHEQNFWNSVHYKHSSSLYLFLLTTGCYYSLYIFIRQALHCFPNQARLFTISCLNHHVYIFSVKVLFIYFFLLCSKNITLCAFVFFSDSGLITFTSCSPVGFVYFAVILPFVFSEPMPCVTQTL